MAAARNLISGNNIGVLITNSSTTLTATGNLVEGNYIGTDITGALDLGNSQQGVEIDSVPGNTIGGSSSGAGNVISANYRGVVITGSSATNNVASGQSHRHGCHRHAPAGQRGGRRARHQQRRKQSDRRARSRIRQHDRLQRPRRRADRDGREYPATRSSPTRSSPMAAWVSTWSGPTTLSTK